MLHNINLLVYTYNCHGFRMIKSRVIGWAWRVPRMGRIGIHTGFWWESQKERDHWENLDEDGRILKWNLEKYNGLVWTGLIWLRIWTNRELL
jgi:hypothetical protein